MKLIIDIDEKIYNIIKNEPSYDGIHPYEEIKNGTPLDKIRSEISNLDNLNANYLSNGIYTVDKHEVLQIIDRHMERSDKE